VNIKFIPLTALIRVSLPFAGNAQGTIRSANEGAAAGEKGLNNSRTADRHVVVCAERS
jgi:hypothetical protein